MEHFTAEVLGFTAALGVLARTLKTHKDPIVPLK